MSRKRPYTRQIVSSDYLHFITLTQLSHNAYYNQNLMRDPCDELCDNVAMLIGYARVSTTDQNLDLQKDALEKVCCGKIFTDTASGAKTERKGLEEAVTHLRAGDSLWFGVWTG